SNPQRKPTRITTYTLSMVAANVTPTPISNRNVSLDTPSDFPTSRVTKLKAAMNIRNERNPPQSGVTSTPPIMDGGPKDRMSPETVTGILVKRSRATVTITFSVPKAPPNGELDA